MNKMKFEGRGGILPALLKGYPGVFMGRCVLSVLLTVLLCLILFPMSAFAASGRIAKVSSRAVIAHENVRLSSRNIDILCN